MSRDGQKLFLMCQPDLRADLGLRLAEARVRGAAQAGPGQAAAAAAVAIRTVWELLQGPVGGEASELVPTPPPGVEERAAGHQGMGCEDDASMLASLGPLERAPARTSSRRARSRRTAAT